MKNTSYILFGLFLLAVAIVVGMYVVNQNTSLFPNARNKRATSYEPTQAVKSDTDLMDVQDELDNANLDVIDSGLNQNASDMKSF